MKLEGSLDAFSLPDIFSLLATTKKTGALHLRRAGHHGVIWLRDGALTGGVSDVRRASLARRIAGSGQVDDDQLAGAITRMREDASVGVTRALHEAGAITDADLEAVVGEQITDTVFDLMRWADGSFEFAPDESNVDDIGTSRPAEDVVSEARRRLESWTSIAERVPSPDTTLTMVLAPEGDLRLSRDEWAMLALIDGRRTVGELVTVGGRGEYAVVGALAELVSRGLVRASDNGIAALARRQSMLAELEGAAAPHVTDRTSAEVPEVAAADGDATDEPGHTASPPDAAEADAVDTPAVRELPVTPHRPEPFRPRRRPDHPDDEPMAAVAGGGPVTVPGIERDPAVNKSLLLRLIAGVRGL